MPSTLTQAAPDRAKLLIPAMFGLLLLGDWLFWQMPVGLSLVLFAWAVFAVAAALQGTAHPKDTPSRIGANGAFAAGVWTAEWKP